MLRVEISRALLDRLRAEAAASPGREICGLLFGSAERIEAAEPCANVSPRPEDRFELDPQALFQAIRAEREGGPHIAGYYHSHPQGPPEPSAYDQAVAAPDGRLWLIVGQGEARAWRSGERFEVVELNEAD